LDNSTIQYGRADGSSKLNRATLGVMEVLSF
jgi:hypothetical protein